MMPMTRFAMLFGALVTFVFPGCAIASGNLQGPTENAKFIGYGDAEVLAQTSSASDGHADVNKFKSPSATGADEDAVKEARQRLAELEEQASRLMLQISKKAPVVTPKLKTPDKLHDQLSQPDGIDAVENAKVLARREAEVAKAIEDYKKGLNSTQISQGSREVGYAMYYKALQDHIEKIGTLNFPQQDGKKLYGELIIYIPIFQDGTIYEKEGGPRIERSSGNPALDQASVQIVRRAAPFGKFPPNMRSTDKDDVWEVITRFKFTREDGLETELRGGSN